MATATTISKKKIWDYLKEVSDPEIPVLNVVEMGIVREVQVHENGINVKITPTYSGCPAMNAIENEIGIKLKEKGFENVAIITDFKEPWTTDWMTECAKIKLKEYGIAPPEKTESDSDFLTNLKGSQKIVPCPYCDSLNTVLQSEFGSTACKSQHYCDDCKQPYEHFKCI